MRNEEDSFVKRLSYDMLLRESNDFVVVFPSDVHVQCLAFWMTNPCKAHGDLFQQRVVPGTT